jgi:hypothetical protein
MILAVSPGKGDINSPHHLFKIKGLANNLKRFGLANQLFQQALVGGRQENLPALGRLRVL